LAAAAPRPGFFFLLIKIKKINSFPVEKRFFENHAFCCLATGDHSAMVKNSEKSKISKKNQKLRQRCCGKRKLCDRCENNSKELAGEHTQA
jgi:hypothetical protein